MGRKQDTETRLFGLLEPVVVREGYELVAIELTGERGRALLRVSIDKPGGISLEDCSAVSRVVDALLEVEDPVEGSYELEVSSPGLERPLVKPTDFERFKGRRVRIKTFAPLPEWGSRKVFDGPLQGFESGNVLLTQDGKPARIPQSQIAKAHLVYEGS